VAVLIGGGVGWRVTVSVGGGVRVGVGGGVRVCVDVCVGVRVRETLLFEADCDTELSEQLMLCDPVVVLTTA
jgi:hypothetical protein